MKEFEFTLKYRLADANENPECYLDQLAEAGCDDAIVGIGQYGRIALNFTRKEKSAFEAISSAISDVQKAVPAAWLVEAAPDYVGVTDLADLFGVSRQYMRKLIASRGAGFPEPLHEGKPTLWHLCEVLDWFVAHESRRISARLHEVARINMQLNVSRSCAKLTTLLGFHQGKIQVLDNDIFSSGEAWGAEQ